MSDSIAPLFRVHGAYDNGQFRVRNDNGTYTRFPISREEALELLRARKFEPLYNGYPLVRDEKGLRLNA